MLVCPEPVKGMSPGAYHELAYALRIELRVQIDRSTPIVDVIVAVQNHIRSVRVEQVENRLHGVRFFVIALGVDGVVPVGQDAVPIGLPEILLKPLVLLGAFLAPDQEAIVVQGDEVPVSQVVGVVATLGYIKVTVEGSGVVESRVAVLVASLSLVMVT